MAFRLTVRNGVYLLLVILICLLAGCGAEPTPTPSPTGDHGSVSFSRKTESKQPGNH